MLNSDLWVDGICNSTYFESLLKDKVPTMTSDYSTYGEVISCGSYFTDQKLSYMAFDNDETTSFFAKAGSVGWIGYKFKNPIKILFVYIYPKSSAAHSNPIIQASNDGNNWITLLKISEEMKDAKKKFTLNNNNKYLYYRYYTIGANIGNAISVVELQFYGRL